MFHLKPRNPGEGCRRSFDQGHYYLQAGKVGAIFNDCNYRACKDFGISQEWVTSLWQCGKISSDTASQEYLKGKKHIKNFLQNVEFHNQCLTDQIIAQKKAAAEEALLPLQKRAKTIGIVQTEFLPQFERPMFRRKFLVLTGPSCMGKTLYGCSFAGPGKTLIVDCGAAEQPDLRHFDPLVHESIIFDECHASTVANNRKVFQGTTQTVSLGHSATNVFAYKVWLYGIKMILTSNRWHEDVAALQPSDQAWLHHNSIVLNCTEKLYEDV